MFKKKKIGSVVNKQKKSPRPGGPNQMRQFNKSTIIKKTLSGHPSLKYIAVKRKRMGVHCQVYNANFTHNIIFIETVSDSIKF